MFKVFGMSESGAAQGSGPMRLGRWRCPCGVELAVFEDTDLGGPSWVWVGGRWLHRCECGERRAAERLRASQFHSVTRAALVEKVRRLRVANRVIYSLRRRLRQAEEDRRLWFDRAMRAERELLGRGVCMRLDAGDGTAAPGTTEVRAQTPEEIAEALANLSNDGIHEVGAWLTQRSPLVLPEVVVGATSVMHAVRLETSKAETGS